MKLQEFRILDEAGQVALLYREGVYIGKRRSGGLTTVLYQLDSFYVEVHYYKYRFLISHITCFRSTAGLDPYLEHMNVEDLVNG